MTVILLFGWVCLILLPLALMVNLTGWHVTFTPEVNIASEWADHDDDNAALRVRLLTTGVFRSDLPKFRVTKTTPSVTRKSWKCS